MSSLNKAVVVVLSSTFLFACVENNQKVVKPSYEILSSQCDKGNVSSCYDAADIVFHLRESGLKSCVNKQELCIKAGENKKRAKHRLSSKSAEQFGKSCDSGRAQACLNAGSSLSILGIKVKGKKYRKIARRAENYFNRGCELGNKMSCMMRGTTTRAK